MSAPLSPSDNPLLPWERRPEESGSAWAAFTRYRDAGADRSLIETYRQETGRDKASQPSGQWTGWYQAYEWKARAAAYDAHKDRLVREANEAEHVAQLKSFRDKQRRLSAALTEASISIITITNKQLKVLADPNNKQAVPLNMLPSFLRAAAATASAATNAEAEALGIEDLLKQLDDQQGDAEDTD